MVDPEKVELSRLVVSPKVIHGHFHLLQADLDTHKISIFNPKVSEGALRVADVGEDHQLVGWIRVNRYFKWNKN